MQTSKENMMKRSFCTLVSLFNLCLIILPLSAQNKSEVQSSIKQIIKTYQTGNFEETDYYNGVLVIEEWAPKYYTERGKTQEMTIKFEEWTFHYKNQYAIRDHFNLVYYVSGGCFIVQIAGGSKVRVTAENILDEIKGFLLYIYNGYCVGYIHIKDKTKQT